jgi:phosphoserine / homoserine phosphotransferase
MSTPTIIAMDLEGVFVPEIWIAVSEKTGIPELRLTTRDIPNYDTLMKNRLRILDEHGLSLADIQAVIGTMEPLPGAVNFLDWARSVCQLVILTDSYYEFISPLKAKLGNPTIFCNSLEVDGRNRIVNYHLRQRDGKKHAVLAFKSIGFRVIAGGDSYNDTSMLGEADHGVLFRPPAKVIAEFPQYPVFTDYPELQVHIAKLLGLTNGANAHPMEAAFDAVASAS